MINLVDIESKELLITMTIKLDVKMICWTQNFININESDLTQTVLDDYKIYLASLPNIRMITTGKAVNQKDSKFYSPNMLNFLLIACSNGIIKIKINGVLTCSNIDIKSVVGISESEQIEIVDVKMNSNYKDLYVLYSNGSSIEFLIFENESLLKYHIPLWKLSVKFGMILTTLEYIDDTIDHINEAWESVLVEMDNKLAKYAKNQPVGAISADFLELLLFGYPSESLETFLTEDVTVRELKKLSNSIELSYSTIQKSVVKPLHTAIVNIFHHINQVYGMHQNTYYYKNLLGPVSNRALFSTGSFLMKSYELQQTIDKSMRDFKIFFRWLYIAIARINDDSIPEEIGTITQQEINHLAEFIYNIEEYRKDTVKTDTSEVDIKFNLERIGQYLRNEDLVIHSEIEDNFWKEMLLTNECLRDSECIYSHNKKSSLIQEKNNMETHIYELFGQLKKTIGAQFKLQHRQIISPNVTEDFERKTSYITDTSSETNFFALLTTESQLYFIARFPSGQVKTIELQLSDSSQCAISTIGTLSFVDVKFYNSRIISILFRNESGGKVQTCFMQLMISRFLDEISEHSDSDAIQMNFYELIDDSTFVKLIDGFVGSQMAISGSRKVVAFLATNQKTVKIYELEVDEDDADEESSNNASFEIN
jgi:anaphase-promoting complex subunit 4